MPRKPIQLSEWDTFMHVEGDVSVDTLWASASILSVIRVRKKIDETRRFAALVGHFSSPNQPVVQEYLQEARTQFGDDVKIILRGGSVLLMESDPQTAKAGLANIYHGERAMFLRFLEEHGYRKQKVDIKWAEVNQGTKIIYRARSGIARVLTQSLDPKEVDIEELPDVF